MPVSIVVGGQYGDEGKGKVVNFFAQKFKVVASVRVGYADTWHSTVDRAGNIQKFKCLPTSALRSVMINIIPSGAYIDLQMLLTEIEVAQCNNMNLMIDPYAVIIDENNNEFNSLNNLDNTYILKRMQKEKDLIFAKDIEILKIFIKDTKRVMRRILDKRQHILIEGTHGFGTSLLHSTMYPYCDSIETSAASFLSDVGLSPLDVLNIIMVTRVYPINRMSEAGRNSLEIETNVKRKIVDSEIYDEKIVKRAIQVNKPNIIVVNYADYFDYNYHEVAAISDKMRVGIDKISQLIDRKIDYIGTGKSTIIAYN